MERYTTTLADLSFALDVDPADGWQDYDPESDVEIVRLDNGALWANHAELGVLKISEETLDRLSAAGALWWTDDDAESEGETGMRALFASDALPSQDAAR